MICKPCRDGGHWGCVDEARRAAELAGVIPGMAAGTSRWCDCQHQMREAGR